MVGGDCFYIILVFLFRCVCEYVVLFCSWRFVGFFWGLVVVSGGWVSRRVGVGLV